MPQGVRSIARSPKVKHTAVYHPKMNRLMRLIGRSRPSTVGLMEMFWIWVGQYCPDGNLTKVVSDIESAIEWDGNEGDFLEALIGSGFVDDDNGRVVVHDWDDHCPEYIKKRRRRTTAADARTVDGQRPPMSALPNPTKPNLTQPNPTRPDQNNGGAEAAPSPSTTAKPQSAPSIMWDQSSGKWSGITTGDIESWVEAYPAVNVSTQLVRMCEWLKSNPSKAKRKMWRRFITNWLSRSQERGGDRDRDGPKPEPKEKFDLDKWRKEVGYYA